MSTKPKPAAKTAAKPKLDLKALQSQQLNGEDLTTTKGSGDDSYEFPEHEADRIHLKLTRKENDPVKKEYVEVDKIVKVYPLQYDRMEKNGSFDEYDSQTILHDPRTKAEAKSSTGPAARTDSRKGPMQSVEGLPTLQDAQMRYQEVYGEKAPADKTYQELVELIEAKGGLTDEEEEQEEEKAAE